MGNYDISDWYVDPAAAEFRVALENITGQYVIPAENDVLLGIEKTSQWLNNKTLMIAPNCVELIRELDSYQWDEKKAEKGDDLPVKSNDHGCDALRYFSYTTAIRQGLADSMPRMY